MIYTLVEVLRFTQGTFSGRAWNILLPGTMHSQQGNILSIEYNSVGYIYLGS